MTTAFDLCIRKFSTKGFRWLCDCCAYKTYERVFTSARTHRKYSVSRFLRQTSLSASLRSWALSSHNSTTASRSTQWQNSTVEGRKMQIAEDHSLMMSTFSSSLLAVVCCITPSEISSERWYVTIRVWLINLQKSVRCLRVLEIWKASRYLQSSYSWY